MLLVLYMYSSSNIYNLHQQVFHWSRKLEKTKDTVLWDLKTVTTNNESSPPLHTVI